MAAAVVGLAASFSHDAAAANDAWSTTPTNGNFSGTNWTLNSTTGGAPTGTVASGDDLYFDGSNITALTNDNTGFTYDSFNFNSDAAAYTIGGNAFTINATGITNNSANTETISAPFTIASGANMTVTTATGTTVLSGAITSTNNENILLSGNGTTVFSGSNANYLGATFMAGSYLGGSGTLQLQFNAGNTTNGVSNVLGNDNAQGTAGPGGAQIVVSNGGTIQLRGDTTAGYTSRSLLGINNISFTLNVDQLTSAGTGQTLSLLSDNANFANNVTINFTGGHGYVAGLVGFNDVGDGNNNLTLNPTTAGVNLGYFSTSGGNATATTLTLDGTDTSGNSKVLGTIVNTVSGNANAVVSVTKSNTSTWTLLSSGSNYTGGTTVTGGMLILAAASNNSNATLGGAGTVSITGGTLQLANSNQINDASPLTLGGGRFNANKFSETVGALTLSANSVLDFGAGSNSAMIKFTSLGSFADGVTLTIADYASGDTLNIGTPLTASQLSQIVDPGFTTSQDANGFINFTAAVPEPSTWLFSVLTLFGGLLFYRRRFRAGGALVVA